MAKHEFKVGGRFRRIKDTYSSLPNRAVGFEGVVSKVDVDLVYDEHSVVHTIENIEFVPAPAIPAPAIRTITRREVVPGQYGIVEVGVGATVGVTFDPHTANDLREAAHLFLQIAEVLDEQAAQAPANDNDGWIEWHGGDAPTSQVVEIRMRDGFTDIGSGWRWNHNGYGGDIVAYRPVKDAA
mgnify:CR=1 FL=1